jgi:hypothetical protein
MYLINPLQCESMINIKNSVRKSGFAKLISCEALNDLIFLISTNHYLS